jgi:hypothetical protein
MILSDIIIGILLIVYGVTKLTIGTVSIATSETSKTNFHVVFRKIMGTDSTFAAKVLEFVLVLFGIYSLLHGLDRFNVFPENFHSRLHARKTTHSVNASIGLILTIFYSLVVYTNLPIQKNNSEMSRYKHIGIITGLSFLIMVPLTLIYHAYVDHGFKFLLRDQVCILSAVCIAIIIHLCYLITTNNTPNNTANPNPKKNQSATKVGDYASLLMIPFNTF